MFEFKNLVDIDKTFPDEQTCRTYLHHKRWGLGVYCPHCGVMDDPWELKPAKHNRVYMCKSCKKRFHCLTGTIFENTKLPLIVWFKAIYLSTSHKKGVSSHNLAELLGVTQKTAWFLLHRIRATFEDKAPKLLDDLVEIDSSFVGGKNRNRHYNKKSKFRREQAEWNDRVLPDKIAVLGVLQRGGPVVTRVIVSERAHLVVPVVRSLVKPKTILLTDEWAGYNDLDKDYDRYFVAHAAGEYGREQVHTNTIEGFWTHMKHSLRGIYHLRMTRFYLQKYCDEAAFRYNNRLLNGYQKFDIAISQSERRLTYKKLIHPKDHLTPFLIPRV